MPQVAVLNMKGETIGQIELNESIFGVEVNQALLHEAVLMHLARRRRGTVATKTRGLVAGGGRKPWRQKGTGRARHGSTRSPIWVGGGTTFGPQPRNYKYSMPKKARRNALRSALSAKVAAGELIILDDLSLAAPKTREMAMVLKNLKVGDQKSLVVTGGVDAIVERASRNLPQVSSMLATNLNPYDVLNHERLILTKDALARVEEVLV